MLYTSLPGGYQPVYLIDRTGGLVLRPAYVNSADAAKLDHVTSTKVIELADTDPTWPMWGEVKVIFPFHEHAGPIMHHDLASSGYTACNEDPTRLALRRPYTLAVDVDNMAGDLAVDDDTFARFSLFRNTVSIMSGKYDTIRNYLRVYGIKPSDVSVISHANDPRSGCEQLYQRMLKNNQAVYRGMA